MKTPNPTEDKIEFNLSEKECFDSSPPRDPEGNWGYFEKEDVKEFIRLENEPIEMSKGSYSPDFIEGVIFAFNFLKDRRDKLIGEKLK